MEKQTRLMSLDTLRGFDMFFITGGARLIVGLCVGLGAADCWLAKQMAHVPWEGLAQHDLIFPLFLFLAGVSWPFSLAAQIAKGRTTGQIHRKVLIRAAVLFLFGLSCGGILKFDPCFRLSSVLGLIGLAWGIAALVFMHVRRPFLRGGLIAALLVGYWALLRFVAAPGAPAGADTYSQACNIISWLDRTLLPNHIYVRGAYDPESIFSVVSASTLALIGMCAGAVLRSDRWSGARKVGILALGAVGSLALDAFFIVILGDAVVKALWSTSFILSAAAYSLALLALFYWIVDVKGCRRWTLYFRVIGMNSITIYMAQMTGVVQPLHKYLFGGLLGWIGLPWGLFAHNLTYCAVVWAFLYFLYRKGIFLKV